MAEVKMLPAGKYKLEAVRILGVPATMVMEHACYVLSVDVVRAPLGGALAMVLVIATPQTITSAERDELLRQLDGNA